jgi:hypothetical protein
VSNVNSQEPVNIALHQSPARNLKLFVYNNRKVNAPLAFILRRKRRANDQAGEGEGEGEL